MNEIEELENWYKAQCNGDWEHGRGVKISTLDNPGWMLSVNLVETSLENIRFETVEYGVGKDAESSGDEWMVCKVKKKSFEGRGGPFKLHEMIRIFLDWAKLNGEPVDPVNDRQGGDHS